MEQEVKEVLNKYEERIEKLEQIAKESEEHFKRIDEILNEHTQTLQEHTTILNEHTKTLEEHTVILNEHTQMLKDLQRSMLIIEDAVTNKIPALFDAYKMQQEKQEEFEQRINQVENKAEMNTVRIMALENNFSQKA